MIHRRSLLRGYARSAKGYEKEAVLQSAVRGQLQERICFAHLVPEVVLDLGCGVGSAIADLKGLYPDALVVGLDLCPEMLQQANRDQGEFLCGDFEQLPLQENSVDLVCANLSLHCAVDVEAPFAEVQRVLKPNGLFSFATFGPDSLRELRKAWSEVDSGVHIHRFLDMHDLGDALIRHGFSEPVLDVDQFQLSYKTPLLAMQDLKRIGESNSCQGRRRGLMGKETLNQVLKVCEEQVVQEEFLSSFELVFGQAWGRSDINQTKYMDKEIHIPLSQLKRG